MRQTLGLVALAAVLLGGVPAAGQAFLEQTIPMDIAEQIEVDSLNRRVYVRHSDAVTVLDADTLDILGTITIVGETMIGGTGKLALDPGLDRVYVSAGSFGPTRRWVDVIDATTLTVVDSISIPDAGNDFTVDPTTHLVYVCTQFSGVHVIDPAVNDVVATIPWRGLETVARSDIDRLYIRANGVLIVDTLTNDLVAHLPISSYESGLAFEPTTNRLLSASLFDPRLTVIDTDTEQVVATVDVLNRGVGLVANPVEGHVYTLSRPIEVVDAATGAILERFYTPNVDFDPRAIVVDTVTDRVYASVNYHPFPSPPDPELAYLSIIDGSTLTEVERVPVGLLITSGLAVDEVTGRVYVGVDPFWVAVVATTPPNEPPEADAGEDVDVECASPLGAEVMLDGSGSTDADSTPGTNDDIETFDWIRDFGLPEQTVLGTGETLNTVLPVGNNLITLLVTDSGEETDFDQLVVDVQDTNAPFGAITVPEDGQCVGPGELPLTIENDFTDVCADELIFDYGEAGGSTINAHGNHDVTLSVADGSGNSASDSVSFTIDTVLPVATIIEDPIPNLRIEAETLKIESHDDDGASGGVVVERLTLEGCVVLDGLSYGDGDGLLRDEALELTHRNLCGFFDHCELELEDRFEIGVEAVDCGGNVGVAVRELQLPLRSLCGGLGRSGSGPDGAFDLDRNRNPNRRGVERAPKRRPAY